MRRVLNDHVDVVMRSHVRWMASTFDFYHTSQKSKNVPAFSEQSRLWLTIFGHLGVPYYRLWCPTSLSPGQLHFSIYCAGLWPRNTCMLSGSEMGDITCPYLDWGAGDLVTRFNCLCLLSIIQWLAYVCHSYIANIIKWR